VPIETLNQINLLKKLGNGFFGEVYRATLPPHGEVAVKIIPCAKTASILGISPTDWPSVRDAIFAEAEALAKGQHPHVVRVLGAQYDAGKDNGYIVTELCDGSIDSVLQHGPLSLDRVSHYIRGALTGLDAMHGRGMVHRDLKPPNLLLKGDVAKLSDFGLVTDRIVAGYASSNGYIEHWAPEVFATDLTSTKSDVWAMGLTLYQMLSGQPWYHDVLRNLGADKVADSGAARATIVGLVRGGGFAKRLPFLPHVPDSWRRFVRKAMHDDPGQRFADGSQMLSAMSARGLPTAPSYECVFSATGDVTWRRERQGRQEIVSWMRRPGKSADAVLAELHPLAGTTGKVTVLRRADKLSSKAAMGALEIYFAARTT
jgi:serine/threonine protein kinase